MGSLLSQSKSADYAKIVIDFDNVKPSSKELEIYNQVQKILNQCPTVLTLLIEYKNCTKLCSTVSVKFESLMLDDKYVIRPCHLHRKKARKRPLMHY
mmetsp:Transcript_24689/g.39632  ORF Transcript_24689/g.39632 Transcript_24689/m.39632 type:complete len:97 (+) Transcript_24689:142-432(+)